MIDTYVVYILSNKHLETFYCFRFIAIFADLVSRAEAAQMYAIYMEECGYLPGYKLHKM